ncbi:hypothetical protein A3E39_00690 [Candidatus Uhrbacteria bacterium RIFCSPHIGHO2_12_FULL_60_25]|uniref:Uncharacterized protein n=1 Tax=Candidatus Uhrbacteria bacterium RIFCSPHIGHO2_12_FULL_60_25 TaxID=1802399 RepID=A0A1F7UMV9_9BACT|nr:MAG: hypothetical protein A3D73_03300 [Candidatus Uhrbacteria bacterium RIFCSPHIGHO2_02_FULL_60_44]OGL79626.1 MAG: hypothetical protein A3E39_00690 [Candidatus Uhrbacteria bacterium RIFCSPHIGHO2_12_FULL_60_25]
MPLKAEQPTAAPQRRPPAPEPSGPASSKKQKREMRMPTRMDQGLADALSDLTPETYLPHLMSKGGEHLVFEFDDPKHRNIVYKINFYQTVPFLKYDLRNIHERAAAEKNLQNAMEMQKNRLTILRDYFGYHAVPAQHLMVRDIPVSKAVIRRLDPTVLDAVTDLPDTVPAWVAVQRRLQFPEGDVVSLNGYYPESPTALLDPKDEDAQEVYDEAHDFLVGRGFTRKTREDELLLAFNMYRNLEQVWDRMSGDAAFASKLKETVKQLVAFTNETGMVLDVAGRNNLVLLKKDGEWTLKLPDALLPDDRLNMRQLERAAGKLETGSKLDSLDLSYVMNCLNTVRYINALAIVAGIPDRVNVPGVKDVPASRWRGEMSRIHW